MCTACEASLASSLYWLHCQGFRRDHRHCHSDVGHYLVPQLREKLPVLAVLAVVLMKGMKVRLLPASRR